MGLLRLLFLLVLGLTLLIAADILVFGTIWVLKIAFKEIWGIELFEEIDKFIKWIRSKSDEDKTL